MHERSDYRDEVRIAVRFTTPDELDEPEVAFAVMFDPYDGWPAGTLVPTIQDALRSVGNGDPPEYDLHHEVTITARGASAASEVVVLFVVARALDMGVEASLRAAFSRVQEEVRARRSDRMFPRPELTLDEATDFARWRLASTYGMEPDDSDRLIIVGDATDLGDHTFEVTFEDDLWRYSVRLDARPDEPTFQRIERSRR